MYNIFRDGMKLRVGQVSGNIRPNKAFLKARNKQRLSLYDETVAFMLFCNAHKT
jgi:hypothetical protein